MAVADIYDALTSPRTFRTACDCTEARRVVLEEIGTHLDRKVGAALMRSIDAGSPGSELQLVAG